MFTRSDKKDLAKEIYNWDLTFMSIPTIADRSSFGY